MRYVIKIGGSVATYKNYEFPAYLENDPSTLLDFIVEKKKQLINYDNLKKVIPNILDLAKEHRVISIWGPGCMGHPLAKSVGYGKRRLGISDAELINFGVIVYMDEVAQLVHEFKDRVKVYFNTYSSFMEKSEIPEYLKRGNGLYTMCSYFTTSDDPHPISSDDIFKFLVEKTKPDCSIMISNDGLWSKPPNLPDAKKLEGELTVEELDGKVLAEGVGDVTGGMKKKLGVILELAEKGHTIYLLTPEEFCSEKLKLKIVP